MKNWKDFLDGRPYHVDAQVRLETRERGTEVKGTLRLVCSLRWSLVAWHANDREFHSECLSADDRCCPTFYLSRSKAFLRHASSSKTDFSRINFLSPRPTMPLFEINWPKLFSDVFSVLIRRNVFGKVSHPSLLLSLAKKRRSVCTLSFPFYLASTMSMLCKLFSILSCVRLAKVTVLYSSAWKKQVSEQRRNSRLISP